MGPAKQLAPSLRRPTAKPGGSLLQDQADQVRRHAHLAHLPQNHAVSSRPRAAQTRRSELLCSFCAMTHATALLIVSGNLAYCKRMSLTTVPTRSTNTQRNQQKCRVLSVDTSVSQSSAASYTNASNVVGTQRGQVRQAHIVALTVESKLAGIPRKREIATTACS